jgi:nicotinate-nucleotide pyrophosphorylase (carboxylating)
MKEGEKFQPIKHVATVKGKARHLLLGERVALNLLARCSGIATKCVVHPSHNIRFQLSWIWCRSRRFRDIARENGFNGTIAGTRKTTPGIELRFEALNYI